MTDFQGPVIDASVAALSVLVTKVLETLRRRNSRETLTDSERATIKRVAREPVQPLHKTKSAFRGIDPRLLTSAKARIDRARERYIEAISSKATTILDIKAE